VNSPPSPIDWYLLESWYAVNDRLTRGLIYPVHTVGPADGPSGGRSYRVNTFCLVRHPVREIQHIELLGHKVTPDRTSVSRVNTRCMSGPSSGSTLCPTYSCQSNDRQHAAAWYTHFYLFTRALMSQSCKRNYGVDGRRQGLFCLQNVKIAPAM
jgi:hypothetical protein